MTFFAANLASLARSKLHSGLSSGARDNLSLHRWVLLKNSITRDSPSNAASAAPVNDLFEEEEEDDDEEGSTVYEDVFAFLFPDPGDALTTEDANVSEAQWLDSVLETLGDDDDGVDMGVEVSVYPVGDDDDDERFKWDAVPPLYSSDDSLDLPSPISVPYPVPYPPFHPPLVRALEIDSLDSCFPPSPVDSLSYDDDDYFPMPDAIEDTSDDESDAPATPVTRSRSSLNLVDPASIPLPLDRPRAMLEPHVYSDTNGSLFYPFELDPLPYPDADHAPSMYNPFHQNC